MKLTRFSTPIAQMFNLPYSRLSIGQPLTEPRSCERPHRSNWAARPVEYLRRHSGLILCSTGLALALFALVPLARAAEQEVFTVAVFDFESKDETVRDLGPKAATLINANLSAEPQIITVERAELEKILGEQELGLLQFGALDRDDLRFG